MAEAAIEKPQVGDYFVVVPHEPMERVTEVFSQKNNAWFVKGASGSRYLIVRDGSEGIWFTLMKIEHGNF